MLQDVENTENQINKKNIITQSPTTQRQLLVILCV